MKKLLVLSVLLGLLVLPVFADHVSIDMGGDHTFGFIGDFGDAEAQDVDLTWDVIVGIDDYNSFTWSLTGLDTIATDFALDQALVTSDVGMWLDLPVGIKVNWGFDDPDANEFQVITGYENEAVFDFSPDEYWGLALLISYNIIEVELAFNPGAASAADLGYLLAGLALKEPITGLNAEVYWFQNKSANTDDFDTGQIGIDAAYTTEVSGIGLTGSVGFLYDMDDVTVPTPDQYAYGVGVAAAMSMFDITLGLDGNETNTLNGVTATVDVAPVDMATIYAGLALSFADDDLATPVDESEALQGADIGVNAHIGLVEAYLGYLITSNDAGDYNAPTTLTDGGMYLKFDVDY